MSRKNLNANTLICTALSNNRENYTMLKNLLISSVTALALTFPVAVQANETTGGTPNVAGKAAGAAARKAIGPAVGSAASSLVGNRIGSTIGKAVTGGATGLGLGIILSPTRLGNSDHIPERYRLNGGGNGGGSSRPDDNGIVLFPY